MEKFKITVPTYNVEFFSEDVELGLKPEYGDPEVPVVVRQEAGLRIILGSHDCEDLEKPDILIERQPHGWMIFLHPLGGSDVGAGVFFLDDGRSFLVKEADNGPTPAIQEVDHIERIVDIAKELEVVQEILEPECPTIVRLGQKTVRS